MTDEKVKTKEEEVEAQRELLKSQAKSITKANQLETVAQNEELAKLYMDNAEVGAENLGTDSPVLKVHQTGKSNNNQLADGTEPDDGWFFYKLTQEQFETLDCHILAISEGFRAPSFEKPGETTFNQVMGGMIVGEGKNYKPFIMYMTGKKLTPMWEFGKAAHKYTHAKPVPVPLFALNVLLSTHKETNSYGRSWLVDFQIKRSEGTTFPEIVTDPGEFTFLRDSALEMKAMLASIVKGKTNKPTIGETLGGTKREESEDLPW